MNEKLKAEARAQLEKSRKIGKEVEEQWAERQRRRAEQKAQERDERENA
jgi:hypothetical protein